MSTLSLSRLQLPGLVLLGIIASVSSAVLVWLQLVDHRRSELLWAAQDHRKALNKGIDDTLDAVQTIADLMSLSPDIDRASFALFAESLRSRHPGLDSLVWRSPRTAADDASARGSAPRDLFPIRYRDPPLAEDPSVPGDLTEKTDPHAREAFQSLVRPLIERALATGETAVSGRIPLEERAARYGVMVVTPVSGARPAAPGDRAKTRSPEGVVVAMLDLAAVVDAAIHVLEPRGVEILLRDLSAPPEEAFLDFYASRLGPGPRVQGGVWQGWSLVDAQRIEEVVRVADRYWSVTCAPTPQYRSAAGLLREPWIMLGGGLAMTLIAALFMRSLRSQVGVRERIEQELRSSEQKLRVLFSQSPDIIMSVSPRGRITMVNRPWPKAPEESAVGRNSSKILPKGLRKWYRKALAQVFASGEAQQFQYSEADSSYWDVRIVPLRGASAVDTAMVIATDVTERRLLAAQAIRSARLATLGVLAASVAHEINNPNNAIQFNAAILQRSCADILPILRREHAEHGDFLIGGLPIAQAIDGLPQMLTALQRNSQRIQSIVGSLKQMARHDPGEYGANVSLPKVLQSAYSVLQHEIQKHTDRCELRVPERLRLVRGNAQQLEQVFINLLLNALQALPDRMARVWVEADVVDEGDQARVAVVDQGSGIADGDLAKIFDPFFTTRTDQGGTGLGLSICRRVIQNHGGTIAIGSVRGIGTEVVVQLPIAEPDRAVAQGPEGACPAIDRRSARQAPQEPPPP
ncbi:ATP-binding protein [Thiorhodococcus minor]|uniref:histidine kinase n=1 Tax=Thiorhodococcus minor TaxID=57489 RepID=A0A6M0JW90_9GAMM|nr:ATP-binding protein [Thiorhodococcus minor]NEV60435.1 PAS domain-containing protein [Thiorhodococcus minor]